jgi:hypothetical protein
VTYDPKTFQIFYQIVTQLVRLKSDTKIVIGKENDGESRTGFYLLKEEFFQFRV